MSTPNASLPACVYNSSFINLFVYHRYDLSAFQAQICWDVRSENSLVDVLFFFVALHVPWAATDSDYAQIVE